jgi:enoyl-CoA hydratase/carnithine racemase
VAWAVGDLIARGVPLVLEPARPAPLLVRGSVQDWAAGGAAGAGLADQLLACPAATIAILDGPEPPAAKDLLSAFDLVGAESQLEDWLAAFTIAPQASLVTARLLREAGGSLLAEAFAYSTLQSGNEFAAWLAGRGPGRPHEDGERISVTRLNDLIELRLTRPQRHNAYDALMREELCDALDVCLDDGHLPVVILGDGPSFCSGGDLDEFGSLIDPVHALMVRTGRSVAGRMRILSPRLVVGVKGWCIGAGLELAAFAAHVVAAEDSHFMLPEVGMGLLPGSGGTVSLPARIGRRRTLDLALSRRALDAKTAQTWGLVDELVAAQALDEVARRRARGKG